MSARDVPFLIITYKEESAMGTEKEAELERTTRMRNFRYGLHDFLAELDLKQLKEQNDRVERNYLNHASKLDLKTKELLIVAACVTHGDWVSHMKAHMHAAHRAGASPEEILELLYLLKNWIGGLSMIPGLEAWRSLFRPDIPTLDRVVELR